jgi:hypothetical protein
MPARQCSKVDLPEPEGPITATISPSRTWMVASWRAGVVPNVLRRPTPWRSGRSPPAGSEGDVLVML